MKILTILILMISCGSKKEVEKLPVECYEDTIIKEETGRITYYEYKCNRCRITGSGDVFDHNGYTIAYYDPNVSKRLYYGKYAKVTNMTTGQSLTVKINDSGMFREGKYASKNIIFDATPEVFKRLGFTKRQGIGNNVKIQVYGTSKHLY